MHESPSVRTPADGQDLPILHQIQGTHSNETRAMQLVVRDPQMLAKIPLTEVPVNFSDEMLLIVTLGRVLSDQYSVKIERIWRERGILRVTVKIETPKIETTKVASSPYCIAIVPKCDLNVEGFSTRLPIKRVRTWEQGTPPDEYAKPIKQEKAPTVNREMRR